MTVEMPAMSAVARVKNSDVITGSVSRRCIGVTATLTVLITRMKWAAVSSSHCCEILNDFVDNLDELFIHSSMNYLFIHQ